MSLPRIEWRYEGFFVLLDLKEDSVEGESFSCREGNRLKFANFWRWDSRTNMSFFIILEWLSLLSFRYLNLMIYSKQELSYWWYYGDSIIPTRNSMMSQLKRSKEGMYSIDSLIIYSVFLSIGTLL